MRDLLFCYPKAVGRAKLFHGPYLTRGLHFATPDLDSDKTILTEVYRASLQSLETNARVVS
jgi:hypothetical protein